jgi:hypothetical protein
MPELNPDHITHEVKLHDGRSFLAVLRDEDDEVILGSGPGLEVKVKRSDIASTTPSKVSLMPAKLNEALKPDELRDLMTFLLTEPPLMKIYHPDAPVIKRSRAEIDALLAGAESVSDPAPIKIVLVSGKKDHGIGEHDYPRWREVWAQLFTLASKVSIEVADDWPTATQWQSADAVVFHRRGDWFETRASDVDTFLARGGGVTFIHWSLEAGGDAESLARRIGLASNRKLTKYRHGAVDLTFGLPHPIMRGFEKVTFNDEMYWNLIPSTTATPQVLATAAEAGAKHPQAWVSELASGGRVFVTLGGHYSSVMDDPLFRTLLLRGIAWSAKQSVDRFNNLIEAGLEP